VIISDGIAVVRPLIISATGFGDLAVLMPLAAVLMIWLLLKFLSLRELVGDLGFVVFDHNFPPEACFLPVPANPSDA
jgi:hypothetical protein